LVEHVIRNDGVGGSIPLSGTTSLLRPAAMQAFFVFRKALAGLAFRVVVQAKRALRAHLVGSVVE
jgi:hypothetical protein